MRRKSLLVVLRRHFKPSFVKIFFSFVVGFLANHFVSLCIPTAIKLKSGKVEEFR